nr:uncharacterized protein CTRU02_04594 [Colletotrichum truncatum]KAF6795784.1 hypothetical protein CTRU02_04594 [Colletotrichum truncatum]
MRTESQDRDGATREKFSKLNWAVFEGGEDGQGGSEVERWKEEKQTGNDDEGRALQPTSSQLPSYQDYDKDQHQHPHRCTPALLYISSLSAL